MLRRNTPKTVHPYLIAGLITAALLGLPALGSAASGGAGPGSGGAGASPGGQTQSGNGTVSASGNGITLTTRASGFYRRLMQFSGSAKRGQVVEIQRAASSAPGTWTNTAQATVSSSGSFAAQWRVTQSGSFSFRAVPAGRGGQAASSSGGGGAPSGDGGGASSGSGSQGSSSSWPTVNVLVYKVSIATIYGPGMWGNHTACGERLRHHTLGVANRTLPCGTHVSLYYNGQTIVVPVIDRGPYANHANWDLTEATAQALHMNGTAKIGAVKVSRQ